MPSIMVNEEIYKKLTDLLEDTKTKTNETSLKRPGLLERMIEVYRKHLGI